MWSTSLHFPAMGKCIAIREQAYLEAVFFSLKVQQQEAKTLPLQRQQKITSVCLQQ